MKYFSSNHFCPQNAEFYHFIHGFVEIWGKYSVFYLWNYTVKKDFPAYKG